MWFMLLIHSFFFFIHTWLCWAHINDIITSKQAAAASAIVCYTWNILRGIWSHTKCTELINGFDDAFTLLCAWLAAPLTLQWDIQQLFLLFFSQWDTCAQLIRERGYAKGVSIFHQYPISHINEEKRLILSWPTIIRDRLHIPWTHFFCVTIIPAKKEAGIW